MTTYFDAEHAVQISICQWMRLDDALYSSGVTSSSSFELLDHLAKLNAAFSINSFALCCSSTASFTVSRQNANHLHRCVLDNLYTSFRILFFVSLHMFLCSTYRQEWAGNNPKSHTTHSVDFRTASSSRSLPNTDESHDLVLLDQSVKTFSQCHS